MTKIFYQFSNNSSVNLKSDKYRLINFKSPMPSYIDNLLLSWRITGMLSKFKLELVYE